MKRRKYLPFPLMLLLCSLVITPAFAHKASDAYLTLAMTQQPAALRVDIAMRDLARAVPIDANGNGEVTWRELREARPAIETWLGNGVTLETAQGDTCSLKSRQLAVTRHTDGPYAVLGYALDCPSGATAATIDYRLFAKLDPLHRGLLSIQQASGTATAVLGPDAPRAALNLERSANLWRTARHYLVEGIWHIWTGFDHLLFLLTLLLPAAYNRGLRQALVHTAKVVSAFTVAHSITLALTVLGFIQVASQWVEVAIAASIVVAALSNLRANWRRLGWALAFAFGLIHGLGFASVLTGLGLPTIALVPALVTFNLGVEIGQLAVVAAILPLFYALQRWRPAEAMLLPVGSFMAAGLAVVWVGQRLGGIY